MEVEKLKLLKKSFFNRKFHLNERYTLFEIVVFLSLFFHKIFFHFDDWDSLHQHVSPEELPPEYGGLATVDLEKCQKQLFENDAKIAANLAHHRLKNVWYGLGFNWKWIVICVVL